MTTKNKKNELRKLEVVITELNRVLSNHEGGVDLIELTDDGVARVRFKGHCVGCPMSALTFENGVEKTILGHCDFVKSVEEV